MTVTVAVIVTVPESEGVPETVAVAVTVPEAVGVLVTVREKTEVFVIVSVTVGVPLEVIVPETVVVALDVGVGVAVPDTDAVAVKVAVAVGDEETVTVTLGLAVDVAVVDDEKVPVAVSVAVAVGVADEVGVEVEVGEPTTHKLRQPEVPAVTPKEGFPFTNAASTPHPTAVGASTVTVMVSVAGAVIGDGYTTWSFVSPERTFMQEVPHCDDEGVEGDDTVHPAGRSISNWLIVPQA